MAAGTPSSRSLLVLPALLAACAGPAYQPAPLDVAAQAAQFDARRLTAPELRDFAPRCGLAAWPPARWDAAALACAGLYFNPDLAQARGALDEARARTQTAAQRTNPTLKLDLEHHADTPGGVSPWSAGPTLEVPVAAPGRRAARRERAEAELRATQLDVALRERQLQTRLARDLAAHAAAGARTALLHAQAAELETLERLLARRVELGYAARPEALRITTERQAAQLALGAAQGADTAALNALAGGVGVPAAALREVALDTAPYAALPPPADPEALQADALTARDEMRLALADYTVAEAALKEAIAARHPDFTLGPGVFFDQGDRVWSLAAAFVLPLFHRNEGPIAEAQARRETAARAALATQARILGELRGTTDDYRAARAAATEAQDLARRQAALAAAAQRRFDAGAEDRPGLVRERLAARQAELAATDKLAAAWQAWIGLRDAAGARLAPAQPDPRQP